jgi:peroxiredoxin family protein
MAAAPGGAQAKPVVPRRAVGATRAPASEAPKSPNNESPKAAVGMSPPLGILLISPGHERAHYALVLATGAAATGRAVVLFATNAGCRLFDAARPLEADPREALLDARGVAGIATLLAAAGELGIRCIACEAGLKAEAMDAATLASGVERAGVVTFLSAVGSGAIVTL